VDNFINHGKGNSPRNHESRSGREGYQRQSPKRQLPPTSVLTRGNQIPRRGEVNENYHQQKDRDPDRDETATDQLESTKLSCHFSALLVDSETSVCPALASTTSTRTKHQPCQFESSAVIIASHRQPDGSPQTRCNRLSFNFATLRVLEARPGLYSIISGRRFDRRRWRIFHRPSIL